MELIKLKSFTQQRKPSRKWKDMEFSCGTVGWGSGIVIAAAWIAAVLWVRSLAQEFPHTTGMAKKTKTKKAAYRMGENICKWYQGVNIQNI